MKCFKCGNEQELIFSNEVFHPEYCENCGHQLNSNYCINDDCERNPFPIRYPCNESACYCPECGGETLYYQKGIISPIKYEK